MLCFIFAAFLYASSATVAAAFHMNDAVVSACQQRCPRVYPQAFACISTCLHTNHMYLVRISCEDVQRQPLPRSKCDEDYFIGQWVATDPETHRNSSGVMVTLRPCTEKSFSSVFFTVKVLREDNHLTCYNATVQQVANLAVGKNSSDVEHLNFMLPDLLLYDSVYKISVVLQPDLEAEFLNRLWRSPKCHLLNPKNLCLCHSYEIPANAFRDEVRGYSLKITAPASPHCFGTTYKVRHNLFHAFVHFESFLAVFNFSLLFCKHPTS